MEKSAARKSAKSQRSQGGGDLRRRSRHPSPPDHENNLFGDGDGEKESLSTASDVRDQATKPASEESEPVGLRTRSKLVMDSCGVGRTPDDSDANEDEAELDPASRHRRTLAPYSGPSVKISTF